MTVHAQKETSWWFFGDRAGIVFDSNGLSATNASVADQNTILGSGSFSSKEGELMFYSDGDTIWTKNHTVMPNGTNLIGPGSSEQPVGVIPHPGNPNQFFMLLSNDATFMLSSSQLNIGLYYHLIDMTLNNGLGDVVDTMKNVILIDSVEEKIAFGVHANQKDFWVVVRQANSTLFHSFLVDSFGINPNPVSSSIGSESTNYDQCEGAMRLDHSGTLLARTQGGYDSLEIFDFNNNTGQIINRRSIALIDPYLQISSLEFSPDNSKLYTSGPVQYDLQIPTQAAIQSSAYDLGNINATPYIIGLQTGLNGRIYGNRVDGWGNGYNLGVINNPNGYGSASLFEENALYLSGRNGGYNLPNFIGSLTNLNYYSEHYCLGDSTAFDMTYTNLDSTVWDFDDPGSGMHNTSTLNDPKHVFSQAGDFDVRLIAKNGVRLDTIIHTITIIDTPVVDLAPDRFLCYNAADSLELTPSNPLGTFEWNTGDSIPSIWVSDTGTYSLTMTNVCGTHSGSVHVGLFYPDTSLINEAPTLIAPATNATYQWLACDPLTPVNGETDSTFEATQNGWYAVVVTQNGCSDTSDCVEITNVGMEALVRIGYRVYPNPTTGILTIERVSDQVDQLTMVDVQGTQVHQLILTQPYSEHDISHLSPGIYFLRNDADPAAVIKVVVTK